MQNANTQHIWDRVPFILKKLPSPGILLVSGKSIEQKNIMTIGWAQFGVVWSQPVVTIMVRPSRFTYKLLQEHDEYTLNVMPDVFNKQIAICGKSSGAFCDKFKETNLHPVSSISVSTVSIKDAKIVIECKIIHRNNVMPENLNDLVLARYYGDGDFHQIITASILRIKE